MAIKRVSQRLVEDTISECEKFLESEDFLHGERFDESEDLRDKAEDIVRLACVDGIINREWVKAAGLLINTIPLPNTSHDTLPRIDKRPVILSYTTMLRERAKPIQLPYSPIKDFEDTVRFVKVAAKLIKANNTNQEIDPKSCYPHIPAEQKQEWSPAKICG